MPVPHLEIRIVQRSKGSSAVAGAAYQAGEKLFSEYDQKMKNYLYKKKVVYTEVMLPTNAPPGYADRATLWNAAEDAEKQWNSQLARRFVVALPREVPLEMCPQMMQEYCREHFVSKGMCCDFAIHDPDPPGHNPHCHIMLTMRAIDENGKWLPKSRKVYDLDENGERIRLPSGNWKSHKEDTVDWNEQYHAEEWRHGWEVVQNKYLELAGSPERVDMRSYERQGLDKIPTVHMGAAVCALERKGIETNIGNLNRDIKAANRMMNAIRSTIQNLRNWIADIVEATKEAFAETEAQAKNTSPDLVLLLRDYLNLRKAERSDWSRYGQQKGTTDDLKAVSKAIIYLKEHIKLLFLILSHHPLPMLQQNRQVIISPLGVLGVIAVCIRKTGQMAHAPADTPAVPLQIAVLTSSRADHGGQTLCSRWFFSDYQFISHHLQPPILPAQACAVFSLCCFPHPVAGYNQTGSHSGTVSPAGH